MAAGITYDPKKVVCKIDGAAITSWDSLEVAPIGDRAEVLKDTTATPSTRLMLETRSEWTITIGEAGATDADRLRGLAGRTDIGMHLEDTSGTQDAVTGQYCTLVRDPRMRRADEKTTWEFVFQCQTTDWGV